MLQKYLFAFAASASGAAAAQYRGFNYGTNNPDGSTATEAQYVQLFNAAQNLEGAPGFNSARLYTMVQPGTANSVNEAIAAAESTDTTLLLGVWASAGQDAFNNELAALKAAIAAYPDLTDRIAGLSVGSEDLYRITPIGFKNAAGVGAEPDTLVSYIKQVRDTLAGTAWSGVSVGHVDTYTAYVNDSNSQVISACDWLGVDAYPYFQDTDSNDISNGASLFDSAYQRTVDHAQGKPVWITETGWPLSGPKSGDAVASVQNAKTYWDTAVCKYLDKTNVWYYTLFDGTPSPSFGLTGSSLSTKPLFSLDCSDTSDTTAAESSTAAPPSSEASKPASAAPSEYSVAPPAPPAHSSEAAPPAGDQSIGTIESTVYQTVTAPRSTIIHSAATATVTYIATLTEYACAGSCSTNETAALPPASENVPAPPAESAPAPVPSAGPSGENTPPTPPTLPTEGVPPAENTPPAPPTAGAPPAENTPPTEHEPVPVPTKTAPFSVPSPSYGPTPTNGVCPTDLSGPYQYPHLIVPVDSEKPDTAAGTSLNGTVSSTVSTIFNFDIPQDYAGKTCSLLFLFPEKKDLETTDYTVSGSGGLDVKLLSSPATEQTSYSNAPSVSKSVGSVDSLEAGNSYVISTGPCAAGEKLGYEVSATGDLSLEYFEDWNPSPLGLFIVLC